MIFFSDMDGTFLTSAKEVSPAGWRALDALAAAGVEFVPCTGRAASGLPSELLAHPAVRHIVSSNGAVALELNRDDPTDTSRARMLASWPLPREKARAIWEIARRFDVTFDTFVGGEVYTRRDQVERLAEFVDDPPVLATMRATRTPVDEDPSETIARADMVERVAMYWKDPTDRDAILTALQGVEDIEVTRSYPTNIEVMEAGTSKGTAMTWLCVHLGTSAAAAVAFGDNLNDVSMLEAAGLGVAVANAEPEVRAATDVTCPSNDEDGVARTIMEQLERIGR